MDLPRLSAKAGNFSTRGAVSSSSCRDWARALRHMARTCASMWRCWERSIAPPALERERDEGLSGAGSSGLRAGDSGETAGDATKFRIALRPGPAMMRAETRRRGEVSPFTRDSAIQDLAVEACSGSADPSASPRLRANPLCLAWGAEAARLTPAAGSSGRSRPGSKGRRRDGVGRARSVPTSGLRRATRSGRFP